jgi:hypothetical protein
LIDLAVPLGAASSDSDAHVVAGRGQSGPSAVTNRPASMSSRSPSARKSCTAGSSSMPLSMSRR